jgi:glucosamine--fructose-6-phosphate aminotransferase (isomerizing)
MSGELGVQMAAEIAEQPQALELLVARLPELAASIREGLRSPVPGVAFLARGSSDNAALFTRYAIGLCAGLPGVLLAPSLTTTLGATPQSFGGWLVVAISQSGATPEIVTVASVMRAAGATVLAVTNTGDSALAEAADLSVSLQVGPEQAVPATKTVTAQMLVGMAIAAGLSQDDLVLEATRAVPDAVGQLLHDEEPIQRLAERLRTVDRLAVVGRGFTYPAALETALKLQETTGVMAHGFSTSDFRHGPIRVSGPEAPVVALAGSLATDADTRALASAAAARQAPFHLLGTNPGSAASWPALGTMAEGILATVRGQQLALALSRELGLDPDHPAGLRKITLTH